MAHILVVEDDPIIAKTMRIVLTSAGHSIEVCRSSEEGLVFLSENSVDLLITDVSLPGESGVDLLDKVRQQYSDMKVVVMSGSQVSLDEATAHGADVAIEKPFASEELITQITKLLGDSN